MPSRRPYRTTLLRLSNLASSPSRIRQVLKFYFHSITTHQLSFLDQVGSIRQHLADIYEREQNWRWAAEVLVGIPLETGQKQYTVDYKLETYLKIARLYLEDDDPTQGEAYINRAAQLQTQTKNPQLQVVYKVRSSGLVEE